MWMYKYIFFLPRARWTGPGCRCPRTGWCTPATLSPREWASSSAATTPSLPRGSSPPPRPASEHKPQSSYRCPWWLSSIGINEGVLFRSVLFRIVHFKANNDVFFLNVTSRKLRCLWANVRSKRKKLCCEVQAAEDPTVLKHSQYFFFMTCKWNPFSQCGKWGILPLKALCAHDGGLALIKLRPTIVAKKTHISSQPVVNMEHEAVIGGVRRLCLLSLSVRVPLTAAPPRSSEVIDLHVLVDFFVFNYIFVLAFVCKS